MQTDNAEPAKPRERLDWVDVAKALSIILIVLLHTVTLIDHTGGSIWRLQQLNGYLTPIRVPLFFVASALFARSVLIGDAGRFWQRIARCAWLFVIWLVLTHIYSSNLFGDADTEGYENWNSVLMEVVGPRTNWFLWSLAVFFILGRVALRTRPYLWLAGAAIVSLLAYSLPLPEWIMEARAYRNGLRHFVFFLIPLVLPQTLMILHRTPAWSMGLAAGAAYAMLIVLTRHIDAPLWNGVFWMLATTIGVLALFMLAKLLSRYRPVSDTLTFVGRYTLSIYVTHYLILLPFAVLASRQGLWEVGPIEYPAAAVMTVLGIAGGIGAQKLADRLGLDWLYALPGWAQDLGSRYGSRKPAESGR